MCLRLPEPITDLTSALSCSAQKGIVIDGHLQGNFPSVLLFMQSPHCSVQLACSLGES